MRLTKLILKTTIVLAVLGLFILPAHADQIFVQQSGTSAAGGDPNLITNTGSFVVGVAGSATMTSPLLIIVGVDGSGVPSISSSACANPAACLAATVGTYGLTSNTGTLSAGQEAYSQLGLIPETMSESYTNWSGADAANGFTVPTSYSLFAFQIPISLSGTTTIDESGANFGSFIIAFDCQSGEASSTGCTSHGDIGDTPFTNAGLAVPEPSSGLLSLLGGVSLFGLALFRKLSLQP